jgi:hypothetical protein
MLFALASCGPGRHALHAIDGLSFQIRPALPRVVAVSDSRQGWHALLLQHLHMSRRACFLAHGFLDVSTQVLAVSVDDSKRDNVKKNRRQLAAAAANLISGGEFRYVELRGPLPIIPAKWCYVAAQQRRVRKARAKLRGPRFGERFLRKVPLAQQSKPLLHLDGVVRVPQ